MELKLAQTGQLAALRALYLTAFPHTERQQWPFLLRQQQRGLSRIYAAVDADAVLGLAVLVPRGELVMINYLAVVKATRGGGLGTAILDAIKALYPAHRLVLEIETPDAAAENNALRRRRKAFYLRNGFADDGVRIQIGGNAMSLLSCNGPVTYDEYRSIQLNALGPRIWKRLDIHATAAAAPAESSFEETAKGADPART